MDARALSEIREMLDQGIAIKETREKVNQGFRDVADAVGFFPNASKVSPDFQSPTNSSCGRWQPLLPLPLPFWTWERERAGSRSSSWLGFPGAGLRSWMYRRSCWRKQRDSWRRPVPSSEPLSGTCLQIIICRSRPIRSIVSSHPMPCVMAGWNRSTRGCTRGFGIGSGRADVSCALTTFTAPR